MTRRILIVDDDADIREVAKVALEVMRDWEVLEAPDGQAGILVAKRERPDLILLDYMMPVQDGAETLRLLQADTDTAHIPVVILTAKSQSGIEQDLLDAGAVGLIKKPFDPLSLADQIEGFTGGAA